MKENEFWKELEFRVCRELAKSSDRTARYLWCDGFLPETTVVRDGYQWVEGDAWIGNGGRNQAKYQFRCRLGPAGSPIDFGMLIPPESSTGWLRVDSESKTMALFLHATHVA